MSLSDRFNLWLRGLWLRPQPPALVRYGVVVLLVGLSALVGLWCRPATYQSPYLVFYAAILISLIFGGFGTGLASTFLSALLVNFLFQRPYGQFSHDLANLARGGYFCLSFGLICWLVDTGRKAAEGQIQTQLQLLDMAAAPVIMCDEEDRITYWNKAAEAVYGWNAQEAIGQQITELLHSVLPEPIQDIKSQLASIGQWSGEVKRTRKDGTAVFVASSWTVRRTGRHGLTRLQSDHDLTEKRKTEEQLRRSEDQFRTMADAMPQLAWMSDPDGWIFWYNQGWYDYTGTTPQQMEGWGWQSVHDPAELPKVMERWQASIATGEPFEMIFPLRSARGEFRVFLTRISPIKDASGKLLRWFGTNTDVDELKRAEKALRESEARLNEAQHNAHIGSWTYRIGEPFTVSDELYELFKLPRDVAPTQEKLMSLVLPEDYDRSLGAFQRCLESGNDFELRYRVVWPDGQVRHLIGRGKVRREDEGKLIEVVGTAQDVTERQQAEEALRESEQQYRRLFHESPVGMALLEVICDGEGQPNNFRFLDVNPAFERIISMKAEDLVGRTIFEAVPLADPAVVERQGRVALTGVPDHFEVYSAVRDRHYEITAFSPRHGQCLTYATDVTERELAEKALLASEEKFRTLADFVPQMVWMSTPEGLNIYFNQRWVDYTGMSLEESRGRGWNTPFHDDDRQRAWGAWNHAVATGGPYHVESRLRAADGRYRWFLMQGVPLRNASGEIVKWFGSCTDIEDMKRAEEALRLSEERLRLAVRVAAMGIWELQLPERVVTWSPEVLDIFGVPADSPQHSLEQATRFIHPEDRSLVEEQTILLLAGKPIHITHRIVRADGELRWIEVSAQSECDVGGRPVRSIGVIRDVTGQHLLEEQFRQAQKMEAVGRLAGGVAHDFNNLLMVITGYGDLLKEEVGKDERLCQMVDEILKAASGAASVTHQLLAFSRKQILRPKMLDLNNVLADLGKMLPRLIGEDIDLEIVPGEGLGRVMADASQIQQVVMNLVVNARDAMPDGGKLKIETVNAEWAEKRGRDTALRPSRALS